MPRLSQLPLLYGDAGAREAFQHLIAALVAGLNPNASGIRVHRGDGGVDTYVGRWAASGDVHVYQTKFFNSRVGPSQRDQIRRSFKAARNNKRFRLRRWTLCLPIDLSDEESSWFTEWAESGDRIGIVDAPPWGETRIESLLSLNALSGIRDRFMGDQLRRQVQEIHRTIIGSGRTVSNRILVSGVPGFRMFRSTNGAGVIRDMSLVPLVFEELLAHGVTKIAVRGRSFEADASRDLPGIVKDLVEVLDDVQSLSEADDLLAPVLRELNLDIHAGDEVYRHVPHVPSDTFGSVISLLSGVASTLFAIDNELQLDFNPASLRRAASQLRFYCRHSDSVAVLAILEGFYARYQALSIETISPSADGTIDIAELLANDEYRELVVSSKLLADPNRVDFAAARIADVATRLSAGSPADLVVRSSELEVARHEVELPRASVSRRLTAGYHPPEIALRGVYSSAFKLYARRKPPALFPGSPPSGIVELGDLTLYGASSEDVEAWMSRVNRSAGKGRGKMSLRVRQGPKARSKGDVTP